MPSLFAALFSFLDSLYQLYIYANDKSYVFGSELQNFRFTLTKVTLE